MPKKSFKKYRLPVKGLDYGKTQLTDGTFGTDYPGLIDIPIENTKKSSKTISQKIYKILKEHHKTVLYKYIMPIINDELSRNK